MIYYIYSYLAGINDFIPVHEDIAKHEFIQALIYGYSCEVRVRTHNAKWKVKAKL
jgi:hypothetical protein